MQNIMKKSESMTVHAFSQFELTKRVLNNLKHFKLSPTTINVLWYLTSCYNPKHGYVFPKQSTIAENLRCSERSVVRAIQSLIKEGLIIVECKYINRYRFTSRLIEEYPQNLSDDKGQNDTLKRDNLSHHEIEQKKETIKEQTEFFKSGGNVSEDDSILEDYAIKHGAKNIQAYINTLKKTKSAENIIKEYRKKRFRSVYAFKQTDLLREKRENEKQEREQAENCAAWVELGKKFGIKQIP